MRNLILVLSSLALIATGACETAATKERKAKEKAKNAPVNTDLEALRPPLAQDLKHYMKGIPGKGTKLFTTINTSLGEFNCELYYKRTPMTVANFVGLARGLKPYKDPRTKQVKKGKYFEGIIFHRVMAGFMVQTGDPTGTGMGGPGYQFKSEFDQSLTHNQGGILSMANAGPGTNGSQFFITEKATVHLNNKHTVFGQCAEVDLVKRITSVPKAGSKPRDTVSIVSVSFTMK